MKKLWRLALVVTLALPLVMTDMSPSPTSAVGTWVSRSAKAVLGIAIRADGEKYMVARGDSLWGPLNWGSLVATPSPGLFYRLWSAVSIATNSSGTHCVAGESGAAITLLYSSNSCASWTQATLVAATTGSVNSVAISDNGQRMFATTSTGAFFASTTASPSFSQRSRTESWTDVATDSLGSVVFATTSDGQILK